MPSPIAKGSRKPTSANNAENALDFIIERALKSKVNTAAPVRVDAVQPGKTGPVGTVTITPLVAGLDGLANYPATAGDPALRAACVDWMQRRYGLQIDPATQLLPVNGSREALFALAQTVIDPTQHREAGGPAVVVLLLAGGLVYSLGAVAYATKRPALSPTWFGFHEVFHSCTIVAAVLHAVAIGLAVFG